MDPLIEQLRTLIINEQDTLLEHFNFGACQASLKAFKSKIGIELPDIFYSFYELFNGNVSEGATVWSSMSLLSLSEIISKKELMDKLNTQGKFDKWEEGSWWNYHWIPFLSDKSNSLICIDAKGSFDGKKGQILMWRNDEPSRIVLFDSFARWLEATCQLINNFKENIALNFDLYTDYCNVEIEKIANSLNKDYPKYNHASRIKGTVN